MSNESEVNVEKVFNRPGAKHRFRKLLGRRHISEKDIDEMISSNDVSAFFEYLQLAGQPIFETGWGALYHGASGRFELYYFDGHYFASLNTDCGDERAGPFRKPFEAAERFSGIFEFEYGEEYGISGAIHYRTDWNDAGSGRISPRMADRMFKELTGLAGSPLSFNWCEAMPGKLFKDLFHDEKGKALLQLHEATRSGSLDLLAAAQAKLEGSKKTPIESDHVLGDEAKYFTNAFDSFVMKVPRNAKGRLKAHAAEWVRLCLPRRVGKKTLVAVMRVENPERFLEKLVPVTNGDNQ